MKTRFGDGLLVRALVISTSVNGLMILLGTVGELVKPLSWLAKVSDVIAAPPGFLIRLAVQPKPNSVASVAAAMMGGLLGSIAFYTVVAWIALRLMAARR